MIASSSQSDAGLAGVALACAALIAFAAGPLAAANTVELLFTSVDQGLLSDDSLTTIDPQDGHVLAIGQFNDADFAVASVRNIAVVSSDGGTVPVTIDQSRTLREFGEIVSLFLAFEIPLADAESRKPGYLLRWGEDVDSENRVVESLQLARTRSDGYRSFRWQRRSDTDDGGRFTTIEVIADSYADYYVLWYLLPPALIAALLVWRKMRGTDADR